LAEQNKLSINNNKGGFPSPEDRGGSTPSGTPPQGSILRPICVLRTKVLRTKKGIPALAYRSRGKIYKGKLK